MPFSDAVDREAAWLATIDDALPILVASNGGPFQIVQARWPRIISKSRTGLYVLRAPTNSYRRNPYVSQRIMLTTQFMLRLHWPVSSGTGSAEADQLTFEQAVDLVLTRISGPFGDKTHTTTAGSFLSVAENPPDIYVHYDDVEQGISNSYYRATITYSADDPEIVG